MKTGWRILGYIAALIVAGLQVTACDFPVACPAIGYVSTITVNLEGHIKEVDEVRLCTDQGCSVPAPSAGTLPMKSIAPDYSPTPEASQPRPPFFATQTDADTWVFSLGVGLPEQVTVRAVAIDGTVLAEQDSELVWTRVGGSEQCGGPMATPPITLRIERP